MNNADILKIAKEQSALECGCRPDDFDSIDDTVCMFSLREKSRVYYANDIACNFVSYGNGNVVSVKAQYVDIIEKFLEQNSGFKCFETPALLRLNELFVPTGHKVCFMAEYFLPDLECLHKTDCKYEIRILYPDDFRGLYLPEWSNALSSKRPFYDRICAAAYDGDKLVGLAGASADCAGMFQIGIDVLPGYRKQGIGSALTSRLALEVLKDGKVPFYCAGWANTASVRNAVRSGFRPAWCEMTLKPSAFVDEL